MFVISAETISAKSYIHRITDKERKLLLRNKDIGEKLGVQNIYDLVTKEIKGKYETKSPTNEQIKEYKRNGLDLIDGEKFVYTHEDIIMPIIMSCRASAPEAFEFISKLDFKQYDIILSREQSVISKITKLFSNEKILLQHSILAYRSDLYLAEHKLAI